MRLLLAFVGILGQVFKSPIERLYTAQNCTPAVSFHCDYSTGLLQV